MELDSPIVATDHNDQNLSALGRTLETWLEEKTYTVEAEVDEVTNTVKFMDSLGNDMDIMLANLKAMAWTTLPAELISGAPSQEMGRSKVLTVTRQRNPNDSSDKEGYSEGAASDGMHVGDDDDDGSVNPDGLFDEFDDAHFDEERVDTYGPDD